MEKTPYEILGVSKTGTKDDIRKAYRDLAKKLHPDLNPGNKEAERKFKDINAAYELVGTPEDRAKYDRGEIDKANEQARAAASQRGRGPFYHQTQQGGGRYSQSFEGVDDDILQSIFGRMRGRGGEGFSAPSDSPGQDVLYEMEVDFKDAVIGGEREITLPSGKRLRVKIPAGVSSGVRLRFSGQGSPGVGKGPAGDAYVELKVRSSALFRRVENDLEIDLPLSISEAVLGGEVKIPTVDGSVLLKIPAGVSNGARLRVTGKGVGGANGKRGDLYTVVKVTMPPNVDDEFKAAVEAWKQRQDYDPRAGWSGSRGDML